MPQSWEDRVAQVLATLHGRDRVQLVEQIAQLAFEVPEQQGDAWLDRTDAWRALQGETMRLYGDYIVENESREAARLLALPGRTGSSFLEIAGDKARVGYQRVADMFEHVDFGGCRRFTMVGCGPLPVTALHVMERAGVPECVLLDISDERLRAVQALRDKFGWSALRPQLCDGRAFDYAGAGVVYVANMVRSKLETVSRILATADAGVQLVVREPYSLGRLWSEKVEGLLGPDVEVAGRGPVSGHLSRDLYLRKVSRR